MLLAKGAIYEVLDNGYSCGPFTVRSELEPISINYFLLLGLKRRVKLSRKARARGRGGVTV